MKKTFRLRCLQLFYRSFDFFFISPILWLFNKSGIFSLMIGVFSFFLFFFFLFFSSFQPCLFIFLVERILSFFRCILTAFKLRFLICHSLFAVFAYCL